MRILVTNDDGFLAPGLDSLARVAERFGETWVVAPDSERSGVSHAITLTHPLRANEIAPRRYALTGTPADCVFIALNHLLPEKPDLVLSGINRGPNLGYDVLYSGTVGGAMEGTIQGIPAVAFSLVGGASFNFQWAEQHVETVVQDVVTNGLPEGITLNVNLPDPSIADFRGFRLVRLGHRHYSGDVIARNDPRGGEYLWIGGTRITMESGQDSDCGVVHKGFASVTPLHPDMMARQAMADLARYDDLGIQAGSRSDQMQRR